MKKAEVKKKWMADRERVGIEEKKVYILKNKELRVKIIWLYYNVLVARHGGRWKTTELVTGNY